ncbi:hypothetical protein EGR_10303 [Echinococcus granulosus]|uniref:Uncharacterized protein n=1 Tax=Echinococcus granulosus TaxID=6210 RepID=W6U1C1_ECHGR|nr:hypothetical protein EGR_10303 [Echinococcus granulosus]EUB54838.1 hypothetical protein EGR_10303 [Echinococcus granulosus]
MSKGFKVPTTTHAFNINNKAHLGRTEKPLDAYRCLERALQLTRVVENSKAFSSFNIYQFPPQSVALRQAMMNSKKNVFSGPHVDVKCQNVMKSSPSLLLTAPRLIKNDWFRPWSHIFAFFRRIRTIAWLFKRKKYNRRSTKKAGNKTMFKAEQINARETLHTYSKRAQILFKDSVNPLYQKIHRLLGNSPLLGQKSFFNTREHQKFKWMLNDLNERCVLVPANKRSQFAPFKTILANSTVFCVSFAALSLAESKTGSLFATDGKFRSGQSYEWVFSELFLVAFLQSYLASVYRLRISIVVQLIQTVSYFFRFSHSPVQAACFYYALKALKMPQFYKQVICPWNVLY